MAKRPTNYRDPFEEFYNPSDDENRFSYGRVLDRARSMGSNGDPVDLTVIQRRARQFATYLTQVRQSLRVQIADMESVQKSPWRYLSFGMVFLVGLAVFALALRVDYIILEELWSRNLANEFFEVPASLQDSVTFKSLQVVFAVLAIHFFVSSIGRIGRGIYIGFLTALVITMLVGVGLLNTSYSLPIGSTLFGLELTGETLSAEDELAALGLETGEATAADNDNVPVTTEDFETVKTVLFFASFGLIFFFVTSVGALFLHYAIDAAVSFTGGIRGERAESDEARDSRNRDHSEMARRLRRARKVQEMFDTRGEAREIITQFLNDFGDAYERGLDAYRDSGSGSNREQRSEKARELLQGMTTAISEFCGNGAPSEEFEHILDGMFRDPANDDEASDDNRRIA